MSTRRRMVWSTLVAVGLSSLASLAPARAAGPAPANGRDAPHQAAEAPAKPGSLKSATEPSRISEVTVYPDRAEVNRIVETSVASGPQEVVFRDLPANLVADSVKASGRSPAGGRGARAAIAGLEVRDVNLAAPSENRTRDLQRRIRLLEDQMADVSDHVSSLELSRQLLLKATNAASGAIGTALATRSFDPHNWASLLAFVESQDSRLIQQIAIANRKRRGLAAQRDLLKRELSQLQGFTPLHRREVHVLLDVARAGALSVTIGYEVPGASWSPVYDLTLEPDLAHAQLTYRAQVTQQTGENWDDVRLALSSGRPDLGNAPPEPGAWTLDYAPPPMPKAQRSEAAPGEAGMASSAASRKSKAKQAAKEYDSDEERSEANEPAPVEEAAVSAQGNVVQFEATRLVSLPGDGQPHQVPIGDRQVGATSSYRVVPRLSPHAFLTAEIANTTPWPLLNGQVRAHLGDDYVGLATLPEDVAPGATFSVAFGADRQVRVVRTVLKQQRGRRGFLINERQHAEYAYKLALANEKPSPIRLTIVEPVPVSGQEDIVVHVSGPGMSKQAPSAPLEWTVLLAPGARREFQWGYTVDWPKDREVLGLE